MWRCRRQPLLRAESRFLLRGLGDFGGGFLIGIGLIHVIEDGLNFIIVLYALPPLGSCSWPPVRATSCCCSSGPDIFLPCIVLGKAPWPFCGLSCSGLERQLDHPAHVCKRALAFSPHLYLPAHVGTLCARSDDDQNVQACLERWP